MSLLTDTNYRKIISLKSQPVTNYNGTLIDEYQPYNESKNWFIKRLNKTAVWILKKIKTKFLQKQISYQTVEINGEDIVKSLMLSQYEIRQIYFKEVDCILIGRDELTVLFQTIDLKYMQFDICTRMGFDGEIKVLGLKVIVCPWIKGWCLLPGDLCK